MQPKSKDKEGAGKGHAQNNGESDGIETEGSMEESQKTEGNMVGLSDLSKSELIERYLDLENEYMAQTNQLGDIEELIENAPLGILRLDINGRIVYENPKLKEILGIPGNETSRAMGLKITEMENVISTGMLEKINNLLHGTSFKNFKFPFTSIYGKKSILSASGVPLLDDRDEISSALIILEDKTDREKTEDILRVLDMVIESSQNPIVIATLSGNLTYVNPMFLEQWGYDTRDEVLGKHVKEFWHDKSEAQNIKEVIVEEGRWFGELVAVKKDRSQFHAQVIASLVKNEAGEPFSMTASFLDITERKVLEQQIMNHASNLEKMVKQRTKEVELENEKFKSLFEKSNDPIYLVDPTTSMIIDCNHKAIICIECPQEHCSGIKFPDLFLDDDKTLIKKSLSEAYDTGNATFISIMPSKLGVESKVMETNLAHIQSGEHDFIQAICRDITQTAKIEQAIMKKTLTFQVNKGYSYLVEEQVLDESLDVFTNVVECGFNGYILTRTMPDLVKAKIANDDNIEILWFAGKGTSDNMLSVNLEDVENKIKLLPRGNVVIILDRFQYLMQKNEFSQIMEFLERLVEFIYSQKWILIISLDPRMITKKNLLAIKGETLQVKPIHRMELERKIFSVLKYVNDANKLGKNPSITEIAQKFNITRDTARKRIYGLEIRGLITIQTKGRFKLMEITSKGKDIL